MTSLLDRAQLIGGEELTAPEGLGDPDAVGELDADPAPGRAASRRRPRIGRKSTAAKAPAKTQRSGGKFVSRAAQVKLLREELEAYAKLAALTWSVTDEHCAGVLNETSGQIAESLSSLLGRSDWLMERFQTTTMLADVVKLGHALLPLGRAVFAHHLTARPEPEEVSQRESVTTVYEPWRPEVVTA